MRDSTNSKQVTVPAWLPKSLDGQYMQDPLAAYRSSDIPTTAQATDDTRYYGFLALDGSWIIMQTVDSTGTLRYAFGTSGYAAAYTGRAGLTYEYLDQIFGA